MEQVVLLVSQSTAEMQGADGSHYFDTTEHFVADGGDIDGIVSIDYNKSLGTCFINGAISEFPNALAEKNLTNLHSILENKRKREQELLPKPTEEEKDKAALSQAKAERADAVSKLTVTVDGMVFDADETSQNRMSRVVAGAQALGVDLNTTTQIWVLANNTIAQLTVAQLAQALKLAGQKQTALWTKPYEESDTQTKEQKLSGTT